jgi:cbb3-type cytochrome oxidase subunit 1
MYMEWFVKAFIRASLAWFTLGIALGLAMAAYPAFVVYRPAHAHMNVVGFITMMIFGVGYQLLPRLFGHRLHSSKLAVAHWWLANVGLALMVLGFVLAPYIGARSAPLTTTGGALFAIGAFSFVFNMWRTFNAADARHRARGTAPPNRVPPLVND